MPQPSDTTASRPTLPEWVAAETGEDIAKLRAISVETLTSLYPDIAKNGPFHKDAERYRTLLTNMYSFMNLNYEKDFQAKGLTPEVFGPLSKLFVVYPEDLEAFAALEEDVQRWRLIIRNAPLIAELFPVLGLDNINVMEIVAMRISCPDLYPSPLGEQRRVEALQLVDEAVHAHLAWTRQYLVSFTQGMGK